MTESIENLAPLPVSSKTVVKGTPEMTAFEM